MLSSLLVPTLEENWSFSPGTAELQRALTLEKLGQSLRSRGGWKWNILFLGVLPECLSPASLSPESLAAKVWESLVPLLDNIKQKVGLTLALAAAL